MLVVQTEFDYARVVDKAGDRNTILENDLAMGIPSAPTYMTEDGGHHPLGKILGEFVPAFDHLFVAALSLDR